MPHIDTEGDGGGAILGRHLVARAMVWAQVSEPTWSAATVFWPLPAAMTMSARDTASLRRSSFTRLGSLVVPTSTAWPPIRPDCGARVACQSC